MNTQIIAIANQKGGVGKTTTCANLGIGLAQAGKKVLLIDGDPQGSLTISLGNPQPDKLPFTLSDAMGRILMDEPLRPGEGILHHPEGVDLMPADIQLSGMEVSLVNAMSRETILRQYLDTLKGQYSHNPVNEALNGWIKEELFIDFRLEECRTRDAVKDVLCRYVDFYNRQRPCFAIGYDTPDNYCKRFYRGELEKKDTFSKRILTEEPKFVQKRKDTEK